MLFDDRFIPLDGPPASTIIIITLAARFVLHYAVAIHIVIIVIIVTIVTIVTVYRLIRAQ
jgi:hypothetical protein